MVINIGPELEAALTESAQLQGMDPEKLAVNALRARFLIVAPPEPRDEWERRLLGIAKNCGVSLSNWAVSSEGIYE
jgi:hypothetical protein